MTGPRSDPYRTLGVRPSASDEEIRAAYRRLVQLHHPDHNGGSAESARHFEEIQEAYAWIKELRQHRSAPGAAPGAATGPAQPGSGQGTDPDVESRLADLERELRHARQAAERARAAARQAARDAAARVSGSERPERPTDEELGYIRTDDTFSKILADARSELSGIVSDAKRSDAAHGVSDLLDKLAAKLTGRPPEH
jgi:DnaJ-class molecular chaperone